MLGERAVNVITSLGFMLLPSGVDVVPTICVEVSPNGVNVGELKNQGDAVTVTSVQPLGTLIINVAPEFIVVVSDKSMSAKTTLKVLTTLGGIPTSEDLISLLNLEPAAFERKTFAIEVVA